jgi:hypothetical protein
VAQIKGKKVRHLFGGTETNHAKSQNNRCPGRESNSYLADTIVRAEMLVNKIWIISEWIQQISRSADQQISPLYHFRSNGTWNVWSGDRNNLMASRWILPQAVSLLPCLFSSTCVLWRHNQVATLTRTVNSWQLDMTSSRSQILTATFVNILRVIIQILSFCVTAALKTKHSWRD